MQDGGEGEESMLGPLVQHMMHFFSTLCPVINTCRKKSHDLSVKQPSQRKN
jgi:hypothetical protein